MLKPRECKGWGCIESNLIPFFFYLKNLNNKLQIKGSIKRKKLIFESIRGSLNRFLEQLRSPKNIKNPKELVRLWA
jgi:hypothetical protein